MTNKARSEKLEVRGAISDVTMDDISRFERFEKPTETSLQNVGQKGFTTLIGAGIVNPFGPTLTVLAADGDFRVEHGTISILHMMLNPFRQRCQRVGQVTVKDTWSPDDLNQFFSLPLGSCPTLLLPSYFLNSEAAVLFYARFLMTFDDGLKVLTRVRRHPANPWKRIEDEVSVLGRASAGKAVPESRQQKLSEDEAMELAQVQLAPDNLKAELQAFLAAWDGAIEFQGGAKATDVMTLQSFFNLFSRLAITCNIPGLE